MLMLNTLPAHTLTLLQELLLLPPAAAQDRATALAARWGFPNNYTLGKHLTEQLVAAARTRHGLPLAIVRPSLVAAVAVEPLPGYIGNFAGPIGASAAMAIGLYHSLSCVSSQPLHVWDAVPGDVVAAVVLAAAAAVSAGVDGAIAAAGAAQRALGNTNSSSSSNTNSCAAGGITAGPVTASKLAAAAGAAQDGAPPHSGHILIVHAATSSTYPVTLMEGWNHAVEFMAQHSPKFRISSGLLPCMTPASRPDAAAVAWNRRWTQLKVLLLSWVLR
jgi:fatty acyl-CoA reductase